jgi:nicotinate-nucleotide adenylyltransferase
MRTPLVEISSTAIRARIAGGRTVRYMTPEAVRRIIEVERLYQGADTEVQ